MIRYVALALALAGCAGPGPSYDFKAARRDCVTEMAQRNLPPDVVLVPGGRPYLDECMRARGFDLLTNGPIPSAPAGAVSSAD